MGSSEPGSMRSNRPVISAAGAPPCSACGSHGPRAWTVGMKRPRSAVKMLSLIAASILQAGDELCEPVRIAQRGAMAEARQRRLERGEPAR